MAYKCVSAKWSGYLDDYVKEFVCDTDDDFKELPPCCTGSTAVSVNSGNVQVVNASGQWAEFGGTA